MRGDSADIHIQDWAGALGGFRLHRDAYVINCLSMAPCGQQAVLSYLKGLVIFSSHTISAPIRLDYGPHESGCSFIYPLIRTKAFGSRYVHGSLMHIEAS